VDHFSTPPGADERTKKVRRLNNWLLHPLPLNVQQALPANYNSVVIPQR
jgi:hypothetical protein